MGSWWNSRLATLLANIVAAQRPSVSTAVARLEDHGRLERVARRIWLLRTPAPAMPISLARQPGPEVSSTVRG
jgi:hypothetical protein